MITFRPATISDAALLAGFNQQLIRDERHRNAMMLTELEERMARWLRSSEYDAIIFEYHTRPAGYALFRFDAEDVYLRQFFVLPEFRLRGIGRAAFEWLRRNVWASAGRIRLDVLVGNETGLAFWRALGFHDYCITMELESAPAQEVSGPGTST